MTGETHGDDPGKPHEAALAMSDKSGPKHIFTEKSSKFLFYRKIMLFDLWAARNRSIAVAAIAVEYE
jgi:hypothetical protein